MSLTSWKEEFYPVDAAEVSEEDALQHSHRKWVGLRPENLAKHGLTKKYNLILDDRDILGIDGNSCALCVHYADPEFEDDPVCGTCPLYKANDRTPCDVGGQYTSFTQRANPEPMIALIEKAISSTVAESATRQPTK